MKTNLYSQGQSLIVVLMVVALVTTVVGTAAFQSVTQTNITNAKTQQGVAEKGAQGLIEKILNNESIDTNADLGTNNAINPSVIPIYQTVVGPTQFVTPNDIQQDTQYIFYVKPYNFADNSFSGSAPGYDLKVYFDSENSCPVLEFTFVNYNGGNPSIISRKASASCGSNSIGTNNTLNLSSTPTTIKNVTFQKSVTLSYTSFASASVVLIRPLFSKTKLGFTASDGTSNVPAQGETITAVVQTQGGIQKSESVYRPYPQINDIPIFLSVF
ncbi:MAG: hypothetical protein U0525_05740 [Patescibacteria group bacterium]